MKRGYHRGSHVVVAGSPLSLREIGVGTATCPGGTMKTVEAARTRDLVRRLAEAEATIEALLSGQIDAVVDTRSHTPVLLSQAQQALRESEDRYRILFEKSPMPKWLYDVETLRFLAVNDAAVRNYGYSREEFMAMSITDILPMGDIEAMVRGIAPVPDGVTAFGVSKHEKKDGTLMDVELTGQTFPVEGRVSLLVVAQDITERRRAEEDLRKSEEQYRQIVEATSDGILKLGITGALAFVNRRFAEMLGYEPGELIGRDMSAVMSPAALANATHQFETSASNTVDTTLRHRDGTEIAVSIAGSTLFDGAGQPSGYLGMVRNVTEQKKLRSQLMVSDRMASVGTLAAGVAHEINNPLAAVIGNLDSIAETLERGGGGELAQGERKAMDGTWLDQIQEPLDDAREAAQRVRFIVRDLKAFSRSPTDEPNAPVDVRTIMESSLRMAWNEIRHRARLVKLYGAVPAVPANEARLGQVFLNLIVNAAQAIPEGRAEHNEVRVTTRLEGRRVLIEVSDTGGGIPPEIIGRIFDAFFTTKPVGIGTGLGLAICHRIVTDMDGELTVESEMGKGTTFRVALPAWVAEERPPTARVEPPRVVSRRGRILLVDDEPLVLSSLKRILSREHEVVGTLSAKEALALCAAGEKFDLVMCDLMMPDMTGMDLHAQLSRLVPGQAERMIFLTGGAFTPEARQFLSNPPREHLEKPFDPANLRAIVQRYLR